MPEAVIVDAVRTPIGRAFKGSLTQVRPDDLTAYVIDQLLERNPDVDPASVADVVCGCGMTQGEQAYNIGRIAVLLSEKLPDSTTGATIARYCASSLNAIQVAADTIRAGDERRDDRRGRRVGEPRGPQQRGHASRYPEPEAAG